MRFTFSLARAVSLGAFLAVAALAADEPAAHFSVDRSLVLVSASVTNKADQVVTGLGKEHFRIFEDHQEQAIRHFTIEETPLSLGLVFDSSASMKSKVSEARRAAAALLGTMNRQDEAFLVEFDRHPRLVVGFTRDDALIQSRLFATKPNGSTAMLDALFLAISQIRKANNPRRALLIISDGWDNNSRYTAAEVLRAVREADVRIYAIMIEGPSLRAPSPAFGANGPDLMEELAEETGGRFMEMARIKDLPDVTEALGREMRSQYVLGYAPSNNSRDGRYRRVEVKVTPPPGLRKFHVSWRRGYFGPTE